MGQLSKWSKMSVKNAGRVAGFFVLTRKGLPVVGGWVAQVARDVPKAVEMWDCDEVWFYQSDAEVTGELLRLAERYRLREFVLFRERRAPLEVGLGQLKKMKDIGL